MRRVPVRVVVLDDCATVADAVGLVVAREVDLQVVGSVATVAGLAARGRVWDPDVVVVGSGTPGAVTGLVAAVRARLDSVAVLALHGLGDGPTGGEEASWDAVSWLPLHSSALEVRVALLALARRQVLGGVVT